jgi:lysophospholipase L1-like esterase
MSGVGGTPGGEVTGTAGADMGNGGMMTTGGTTTMDPGEAGSGMGGEGPIGMAGAMGMAGGQGVAGTGAAGMPVETGECVVGQTQGSEVAMIGESFIAATHQITQQVEARAKAAGSLAQDQRYVDNSVSGTTLANNQIPSQYDKAVQSSGTIKYVLMDGGGNDCLINNNGTAALSAAEGLFQNMAANGTEKVVFFFYPDPIGANFSSLKSCLDALRPDMKAICDGLEAPKCYWLDLRDVWNGHNEYTADGIHPTTEGSQATGDAIWDVMVENCVAQ